MDALPRVHITAVGGLVLSIGHATTGAVRQEGLKRGDIGPCGAERLKWIGDLDITIWK